MWPFKNKRKKQYATALLGKEGGSWVIIDFLQANGLKLIGGMGSGKSMCLETLLQGLIKTTPNIRVILISTSGKTDFLIFEKYSKFEFYNPYYNREKIKVRLEEINRTAQANLIKMEENGVRHIKDANWKYEPIVVAIDELESCFSVEKDLQKEERELNQTIINHLNSYIKLGRKLLNIFIGSTQTQTLSASPVALRLCHYSLVSKVQTKALLNDLGIPENLGTNPNLKQGLFLLLGQERIKLVKVGRYEP